MMGAIDTPSEQPMPPAQQEDAPSPGMRPPAATAIPFPVLGAPTVVHVSKLTSDAISRCNLSDVEYVVIEPAQGGMWLRPAGIEDQVRHEQEGGLGHVTYSLGEFLDEFTSAPSNPAPSSNGWRSSSGITQSSRRPNANCSERLSRSSSRRSVRHLRANPGSHSCESSKITRASSK